MDIQDWVDDIRIETPDALDTTIKRAVVFAVQEFFRGSEAWRYKETVAVDASAKEYALAIPSETFIFALADANITPSHGGRYSLAHTLIERIDMLEQCRPSMVAFSGQDTVVLDGVDGDYSLDITVKVQPTREVEEVPDDIANKFFEYIRAGALMRLLLMPNKPWSDSRAAANHQATFVSGINQAKREARNDRSRPRRAVRFNKGFSW